MCYHKRYVNIILNIFGAKLKSHIYFDYRVLIQNRTRNNETVIVKILQLLQENII